MGVGGIVRFAFLVFGLQSAWAAWVPCDTLPSRGGSVKDILSYGRYLFVATEDAGLFRSADHGATWSPVKLEARGGSSSSTLRPDDLQSLHARDSLLLVGDLSDGVLRSTDSGATWLAPDKTHDGGSAYDFISVGSTLYTIGGGFYRSTDNGKSWPPVPGNFSAFAYWFAYNGTGDHLEGGRNRAERIEGLEQWSWAGICRWNWASTTLPAPSSGPSAPVGWARAGTKSGCPRPCQPGSTSPGSARPLKAARAPA